MSFKETYKTITSSEVFKKFIKENPSAELCTGFFILDFLSNDNKKTLDYKIDSKIFTFSLNEKDEITMQEDKLMDLPNTPKLQKIEPEVNIEIEQIKGIAKKQALHNGISADFHKIIAVLQKYKEKENYEDKQVWSLTCMLEQLIILHILIDSKTGDILKFERKSMMDMIRKIKS